MASENDNKLKLSLVHGQNKHQLCVELPGNEASDMTDVMCVHHLAAEVEKVTGVPAKLQKLIFKGKSLSNPEDKLSDLKLKPGSKLMLIGKKPSTQEDKTLEQLKNIENTLEKHEKKLSDVKVELEGVKQGFVQKDIRSNQLNQLSKRILGCSEDFMKGIEKLDAIEIGDYGKEIRIKRKGIVDRCQKCLDECDKMTNKVNELQETKS